MTLCFNDAYLNLTYHSFHVQMSTSTETEDYGTQKGSSFTLEGNCNFSVFNSGERLSIQSKNKSKMASKKDTSLRQSQRGNSKIAQFSLYKNAKRQTTIWAIIP